MSCISWKRIHKQNYKGDNELNGIPSFTGFAFGVSVWLIYSSIKLPRYSSLGFILIASGAIGNAIDRILYGKVVDFIDFHIEDLHWPAFNLADTIIFIGATLFLYNQFFTIERTYYEN